MKKSLIALAVAGAIAVPSIAAADATLYGSFRIGMTDTKNSSIELKDQFSRIGIKGTVDLGMEDTKGIFLWENGLDLNDGALANGRYAYAGATGSWGTVLAGKMDHPSVTMVSDYTDFTWQGDYTTAYIGNDYHFRQGNTLAYASPDFNGVQFVVGGVFAGDALSAEGVKDKAVDGYNLGVKYDANGFYAAAAYGDVKSGKDLSGDYNVDQSLWGLAAGYTGIENLDLRAAYTRIKDKTGFSTAMGAEEVGDVIVAGDKGKATGWALAANYDIGNTSIYGNYGEIKVSPDAAESGKGSISYVGVSHAMGNGAIFVEHVNYGKDLSSDDNYTTVGYVLSF